MKRIIDGGNVNIEGRDFRIWGNKDKKVFEEIILGIYSQMVGMLSHHSRVLVLRFDFSAPEYSLCNTIASDYFRLLKKQLLRSYKMSRVGYVWVREQKTSDRQHYHCAIIVDANKVRHPKKIIERIQRIAKRKGLKCANIPRHCYYLVARADLKAFCKAFYRLSYLAKVDTKQARVGSNNDYSTSRIKRKVDTNGLPMPVF